LRVTIYPRSTSSDKFSVIIFHSDNFWTADCSKIFVLALKTIVLTLGCLLGLGATAQDVEGKRRMRGRVTDVSGGPVPFASIVATTLSDSVMSGGAQSDVEGNFQLNLVPGNYTLTVSFVSYQTLVIPNVVVGNSDIDLGAIILREASEVLEEVIITGRKDAMELSPDKRVFNVGQDLRSAAGSASDVLNNLPSISVDPEGQVSLRGSENVTIWINGKPSSLTTRDPDALRKLQGNLIERVEVITNPSSRYDAAGDAGIINIILKKDAENGLNGTFAINAGYPTLLGASYALNYRRGKLNLFSMYGFNHNNTPGRGKSFQTYTSNDTSFTYSQNSTRRRNEVSHNVTLGADYYFDPKTSLTTSLTYNPSRGNNTGETEYIDMDENGLPINYTWREEVESEDEADVEGVLNFSRAFRRKGQLLTIDSKYIYSRDNETTDYVQLPASGLALYQQGINFATEKNLLLQADYVHPFGSNGKIETGIKVTERRISNIYRVDELQDEQWTNLPQFTNDLLYVEKIQAVYAMASNTFDKLTAQAGLRAERTDVSTELLLTQQSAPQNYVNLFPSANLSWKMNGHHTLQASYSYRIGRPWFRNLLPFGDYRDPRSLFLGNPALRPEFTHSIEIGYLLEFEKGSVLSSVYNRLRKDVVQRITEIDESGIARVFPVNLDEEVAYGIELNLSLTPFEWWRLNASGNFFRSQIDGAFNEQRYTSDTYSWMTRSSSNITLWKELNFQSSINYMGPRVTPQGKDLASYSVDLSLSYDLFKGNATLTAGVRDLFNTRVRRRIVDSEGYYSDSYFQGRLRQFTVTFTYRLNRDKEKKRERGDSLKDDTDEPNDEN
jgi:outer membrane receptor protein involved in Fe transport